MSFSRLSGVIRTKPSSNVNRIYTLHGFLARQLASNLLIDCGHLGLILDTLELYSLGNGCWFMRGFVLLAINNATR